MAVETRYVVIRNGEEVMSSVDKKEADEYDRMLDMAEAMFELLGESGVELSDDARDSLSIYLAKNKEDVLVALGSKRAMPKPKQKAAPKADKKTWKEPKAEEPGEQVNTETPAQDTSDNSEKPAANDLGIFSGEDENSHVTIAPAIEGGDFDFGNDLDSPLLGEQIEAA